MLHIEILSVWDLWIEYTDEVMITIPEIFTLKKWDTLQKSMYYPERIITDIKMPLVDGIFFSIIFVILIKIWINFIFNFIDITFSTTSISQP